MKCPKCDANQIGPDAEGKRTGGKSGIIDCRPSINNSIRRRRACWSCGHRWTTVEVIAEAIKGPGGGCFVPTGHDAKRRDRFRQLADTASEMAEAIRAELNEQTVLSL